jgi:hypothetical protein
MSAPTIVNPAEPVDYASGIAPTSYACGTVFDFKSVLVYKTVNKTDVRNGVYWNNVHYVPFYVRVPVSDNHTEGGIWRDPCEIDCTIKL